MRLNWQFGHLYFTILGRKKCYSSQLLYLDSDYSIIYGEHPKIRTPANRRHMITKRNFFRFIKWSAILFSDHLIIIPVIRWFVQINFIAKLDHFYIYIEKNYNKMVQPSMSGFQMTGYSSDVQISNGLQLSNSSLSINRAIDNWTCPVIVCSL